MKMIFSLFTFFIITGLVSCSAPYRKIDAEKVTSIPKTIPGEISDAEEAKRILERYSIDFTIPNPFLRESVTSSARRIDPNHPEIILCRAVLVNDISAHADSILKSFSDTTAVADSSYIRFASSPLQRPPEDSFYILISMESGFAAKSMEPEHWVIYLENSTGIMIEPKEISATPVRSFSDSVSVPNQRTKLARNLFHRDILIEFSRNTFYGEDLLGHGNPFIVLVLSHNRKTVARVAWQTIPAKE